MTLPSQVGTREQPWPQPSPDIYQASWKAHTIARKEPDGLPDLTYDVFLSVCGTDRAPGRLLATELRALGLRVFVDEDNIEPFTPISSSIWSALAVSKCLVAYYSAEYAVRPSCQFELMAAYLAGQSTGDPVGRILVINPEPETRHLRPVELANTKFAVPSLGFTEIAALITKRLAAIDGPIGAARSTRPPQLPARLSAHVRNLIGRYTELWDLHTALFGTDYPLIEESACGPFASVHGLPGAGKTALVATYAWRFAAAFAGGVRWSTFAEIDTIVPTSCDRCSSREGDMLWVVDEVPDDVDTEALLNSLPRPGRTVLISDSDLFRDQLPGVLVSALPRTDAAALLDRYRTPDNDRDEAARYEVVDMLGGNPAALVAAARYLRDRHDLASYLSISEVLKCRGPLADTVFGRIQRLVARLTGPERTLLGQVGDLGTLTFSTRLLATMPRLEDVDVPEALAAMLTRGAVHRNGPEWRFDPLVIRAASMTSIAIEDRNQHRQPCQSNA